jgi:hypothetical protein
VIGPATPPEGPLSGSRGKLGIVGHEPRQLGQNAHLWSATGPANVYESWAHAVCLLPMCDWPLWEFARRSTAAVDWAPTAAACDGQRWPWATVVGLGVPAA